MFLISRLVDGENYFGAENYNSKKLLVIPYALVSGIKKKTSNGDIDANVISYFSANNYTIILYPMVLIGTKQ